MTYDEAIAFWFGRINFEVKAAAPADLKLERMRALLRRLGDPHLRLRVVHVAGTKGKGSTCALIEAAARAAGYRVGLFTSPHLEHVEERIEVDRVPVSAAELAGLMADVAPAVRAMDALGEPSAPTFFEMLTALGLLHFVRRRAELVLLEVGLGGRFDSTNVCEPLVTAVTSIGIDHTEQLGPTEESIAYQKAGIIKPGVPVVVGPLGPAALAVVDRVAADAGAHVLATAGRPVPDVALPGAHQRANAAVALGVIDVLNTRGYRIPAAAVAQGFGTVDWPARIEVVGRRPMVVVDSAHNVPSVEALLATLKTVAPEVDCRESRHLIFAVSKEKQFREMLVRLGGYFGHFHLTRFMTNLRHVPPERLAEVTAGVVHDAVVTVYATPIEAWRAARVAVPDPGLVCITGSAFLAGELRSAALAQFARPPK